MQGVHGMTLEEQHAADTNYATQDLYDQIRAGNFPKWDLMVQFLPPEQAAALDYDAFDDTKIWDSVPEVKVGTMTLNKVPDNYFEATEESAFAPSAMVPGIEASPDKMLQGRLFAYADTQRYRLGVNYQQLPINRPLVPVNNNNWDGAMQRAGHKGSINFEPTNADGPKEQADAKYSEYPVGGTTQQRKISKPDDFRQAGALYRSLSPVDRDHLIKNLASDLGQVKSVDIRSLMVAHFYAADKDYGARMAKAVNVTMAQVQQAIAAHPEQFPAS
ncbi:hypothetical protein CAF53_02015 [Sphingobium sp. LB126]|nr:hypothetical protein CAF53_02015 [Sphingobium sp. LB126]